MEKILEYGDITNDIIRNYLADVEEYLAACDEESVTITDICCDCFSHALDFEGDYECEEFIRSFSMAFALELINDYYIAGELDYCRYVTANVNNFAQALYYAVGNRVLEDFLSGHGIDAWDMKPQEIAALIRKELEK